MAGSYSKQRSLRGMSMIVSTLLCPRIPRHQMTLRSKGKLCTNGEEQTAQYARLVDSITLIPQLDVASTHFISSIQISFPCAHAPWDSLLNHYGIIIIIYFAVRFGVCPFLSQMNLDVPFGLITIIIMST